MINAALCLPLLNCWDEWFSQVYLLFSFCYNCLFDFSRRRDPAPTVTSHTHIHLIWNFLVFISVIIPTISSMASLPNTLWLMTSSNSLLFFLNCPQHLRQSTLHQNSKFLMISLSHITFANFISNLQQPSCILILHAWMCCHFCPSPFQHLRWCRSAANLSVY
jgi:hypothetical protein